ncbi:MAG TPA: iron uptake porin [Candidatus Obscuribacterales bacterium]
MSNTVWNSLLVSPAVVGVSLMVSTSVAIQQESKAIASEMPEVQMQEIQGVSETPTATTFKTDIKSPAVAEIQTPAAVAMTPTGQIVSEIAASKNDAAADTSVLEQLQHYSNENSDEDPMGQLTSVSQFRDVQPSDWAYEALSRIVQNYGCLQGYPDGTYRGNRALSRYEFAAGLNACFKQVEALIAKRPDAVSRTDFETLQRLLQEFRSEVATLGTQVDILEGRTAFLEARQFSTTTKLNGEIIFALVGVTAGENALDQKIDRIPYLGTRTRLNFDSSFTGQDLLRTRFQVTNLDALSANSTFTPEGDLRYTAGAFSTGSNDVVIDALLYSFPIGKKTTVILEANAGAADDFTNTVNPGFDGDGASGALSQFATRNPIYYLVNGAGIGLRHSFSDNLELSLGYLSNSPADPTPGNGLFNGPYGGIAQLTVKPSSSLNLGLTYVHAYNNDFTANGSTGSNRANLRSALLNNSNLPTALQPYAGSDLSISSNAYGLQASLQITPNILLGGWVGYTTTRTLSSLIGTNGTRGDLSIWNYAVTLGFPDLIKKGNFAGIVVGMEPKVTRVSDSLKTAIGTDKDTSLHIEGFYQYQLTDNIAVTPGVIWLTAPDHDNNHKDAVIGTIRTTFTF